MLDNTTYEINIKGSPTSNGTLRDAYFRGVHNSNGDLISGTTNDDGGTGYNSKISFTTTEPGTYYLSAGAYVSNIGTYTLSIDVIISTPILSLVNDTGASSRDNIANDATVNVGD